MVKCMLLARACAPDLGEEDEAPSAQGNSILDAPNPTALHVVGSAVYLSTSKMPYLSNQAIPALLNHLSGRT